GYAASARLSPDNRSCGGGEFRSIHERLSERFKVGFLKRLHFGEPTLFEKGEVGGMGVVGIVVGAGGEPHGNAEGVIELRTGLTPYREVHHFGNGGEGGGFGEKGRFLGRAGLVPEAEGDGVFYHVLIFSSASFFPEFFPCGNGFFDEDL